MIGSNVTKPKCTTKEQFDLLEKLAVDLFDKSEKDLYDITGCKASCHLSELQAVSQEQTWATEINGTSTLRVAYYYANPRHDIWTQYVTYDYDSFIADVGGYLGLLLGHSMFSLFGFLLTHGGAVWEFFTGL